MPHIKQFVSLREDKEQILGINSPFDMKAKKEKSALSSDAAAKAKKEELDAKWRRKRRRMGMNASSRPEGWGE